MARGGLPIGGQHAALPRVPPPQAASKAGSPLPNPGRSCTVLLEASARRLRAAPTGHERAYQLRVLGTRARASSGTQAHEARVAEDTGRLDAPRGSLSLLLRLRRLRKSIRHRRIEQLPRPIRITDLGQGGRRRPRAYRRGPDSRRPVEEAPHRSRGGSWTGQVTAGRGVGAQEDHEYP